MTDNGETQHPIECPGHGPMERLMYQGVVVRIQCRFCGQRPLDLLEREYVSNGGSDV